MSYLFHADTVFYNAFYAVQNKTDFLMHDDIFIFCSLLDREIQERLDSITECCNVVFDLGGIFGEVFEGPTARFTNLGNRIANLGPRISDDDISFINCHFSSQAVLDALAQACTDFADYIVNKELDAALLDYTKKLTVI